MSWRKRSVWRGVGGQRNWTRVCWRSERGRSPFVDEGRISLYIPVGIRVGIKVPRESLTVSLGSWLLNFIMASQV